MEANAWPLTGRSDELRSIAAALRRTDGPRGLVLAGAAGVGKTRLTTSASAGPDLAFAAEMLEGNGRLYERARSLGGTQYPIGSLPLRKRDWIAHYGRHWPSVVLHKRRHDPAGILTPGPGVF